MRILREFRVFLFLSLALTAQAQASGRGLNLSIQPAAAPDSLAIRAHDRTTGLELAGVAVDVESLDGTGASSAGLTDPAGLAQFAGLNAASAYRVDLSAAGYATTTVFLKPGVAVRVELGPRAVTAPNPVRATGVIQSWPTKPKGIQAGLVFSSLSASDLLGFSVDALISKEKDVIDVFGERKIPSNLVFPDQRVTLLVGRIRLNKPEYRLPIAADPGSPIRLTAIQGEVSATDAIFNGSDGLKLLNKTRFRALGVTAPFALPASDFRLDLKAPLTLAAGPSVVAPVPPFDADVLAVNFLDLNGDRTELIPTDVKLAREAANRGKAAPIQLVAPARGTAGEAASYVLTLAIPEQGKLLSGLLSATAASVISPASLPAPPAAPAAGSRAIAVQAPKTGIALALVDDGATGERLQEIYSLPSVGKMTVTPAAGSAYVLLNLELGRSFSERAFRGETALHTLEAFSRNAGNF